MEGERSKENGGKRSMEIDGKVEGKRITEIGRKMEGKKGVGGKEE